MNALKTPASFATIEQLDSSSMNRPHGVWTFLAIGMSLYLLQTACISRSRTSLDVALAGTMAAGLVFAYLAYRRSYEGAAWSEFGFVRPRFDDLLTGIACGVVSYSAAYLCFYLNIASSALQSNLKLVNVSGPFVPLSLFWMIVTLAFAEECLFRAYLIPRLEAKHGTRQALFLSSAMFGAVHFVNIFPTALVGIILGAAFLRRRSIWASFIAHFVHNAIVIVLVYAEAQRALR